MAHPWRAVARTALAILVGVGIVLPVVWAVVVDELGAYVPPETVAAGAWLVGLLVAASSAITRIMAIPAVNAWLTTVGLGAAPRTEDDAA